MSQRSGHRTPSPVQILAIALTLTLALPFLAPFTGEGDRARAAATASVTPSGLDGQVLESLESAILWLGVTSPANTAELADLRVQVLLNGTVVGSGQTTGEHIFGPALHTSSVISVNLHLFEPVVLQSGDTLGVRVLVRRSHRANMKVRLWYDAPANDNGSTVIRAVVSGKLTRFFLRGTTCPKAPCTLPLGLSAGNSAEGSVQIAGARFKPFGTWNLAID